MSVSILAREIKDSPTLVFNEKARILRERGEPVIHLGSGEPKSKTPLDAILSCTATLRTANIHYTATEGIPPLLKAICRYTEEHYNKIIMPENIIVSSGGAKQAIFNLLMSIVDPQDEVIILAPYWVSYTEIVKMVHGVPVIVTSEDGRFEPRIEDIIQSVSSYTKAIMVNSPNNPSGCIYSEKLIGELVEFCESKGIYLIMDDIYHQLYFGTNKPVSVYKHSNKDIDNSKIVVINGISKAYAMTGFRIGWAIGNRKLIHAMRNISAQNTSCPSVVLQAAAVGALNGIQSGVETLRLTLENNKNVMMRELRTFRDVRVTEPQGTFYCLPDFSAYNKSSNELAKFILDKALVVTIPGVEFGFEGHLRLSYCGSVSQMIEGIARIKWALDFESPNEIYIGERKMRRDWK